MIVHAGNVAGHADARAQGVIVRPATDLRNGYALLFERDPDNPFVTTPARGEEWQRRGQRFAGLLWAHIADLAPLAGDQRWWEPPVYPIAIYCEFSTGDSIVTTAVSDALLVIRPQRPHRRAAHRTP
ncbi:MULTISPECIES: hypothetical protein [unclassified Streptosporangium]|uniref:hypothetical protein n=1 Tax=unclassified Streptosporangium TaxID=2632669 RepID=UPI002E2DD6AE|nr:MULTISPECIES: hypothetical protein [unclassified Streptosporangium]